MQDRWVRLALRDLWHRQTQLALWNLSDLPFQSAQRDQWPPSGLLAQSDRVPWTPHPSDLRVQSAQSDLWLL
jgi:hypothetical protein